MFQSAHAAFRNTTGYCDENASSTCVYSSSSQVSYWGSPGPRHVGHDGSLRSMISFMPSWMTTTSGENSMSFCHVSLDRSAHHEQYSGTSRKRPSGKRRVPPRASGHPGWPRSYTETSPVLSPHAFSPAASPSAIESPTTAMRTLAVGVVVGL